MEKAKLQAESQKQAFSLEVEKLQSEIQASELKFSALQEAKTRESTEKNTEISTLTQSLENKTNELNLIENELEKITTGSDKGFSQGGSKSLWSHIDQLNKQIEEKNYL